MTKNAKNNIITTSVIGLLIMKIFGTSFYRNNSSRMVIPTDIGKKSVNFPKEPVISNNLNYLKSIVVPVSDSFVYILK